MQKQAAEIDTYARANIKDYKKLSSPVQSQIRRIIEDGRAKGISDSDVLAYAKVAAHSGLDIVFDKEANVIRNDTSSTVKDGPPSLVATRSQNGSDVINVIHYRPAASLP